MLIDDEGVGEAEQLAGNLARGRQVEEETSLVGGYNAGRHLDGFDLYFELGDEHPRSFQVFGGGSYLVGTEASIGAGRDDDGVLPVWCHGYKRGAGRCAGDSFYPARVYPVVAQVLYQLLTEGILAYPSEHRHFGAKAGGGDGLVGALAAGIEGELGVGDSLAGLRTA